MPTKWVVTTPSDHIELDQARQGQITFTVTNPTDRSDRVVFDVVPQEGAESSWFSVDEPQRRVPAAGSVSYVVKTAIPQQARPGSYSLQGRAYSADSAPEEDSVLSGRLAVEVKPQPAPPPRKKFPWWIVVVAALVVIVLIVVLVLVLGGGGKPNTAPSAPPPGGLVTMPDLTNQTGQQANTNVVAFGLTVGTVRYVLDPRPNRVVYQSVAGGAKVPRGTKVDLVVATALAKPVVTAPANGGVVKLATVSLPVTAVPTTPVVPASGSPAPSPAPSASAAVPPGVVTWTDSDPFVKQWLVYVQQQICVTTAFPLTANACSTPLVTSETVVSRPSFAPLLPPAMPWVGPGFNLRSTNVFAVVVMPIDDFGHAGTPADAIAFTVA